MKRVRQSNKWEQSKLDTGTCRTSAHSHVPACEVSQAGECCRRYAGPKAESLLFFVRVRSSSPVDSALKAVQQLPLDAEALVPCLA